jgi:hypothetical protein
MKRASAYLVIIGCALLFVTATVWLLQVRIEQGTVYPPGSSLRADPLGTMMLWESLATLSGVTVERDHSPVTRLPHGKNTTYLHLGASSRNWRQLSTSDERAIEQFVLQGGRLVVTLHPETWWQTAPKEKPSPSPTPQASPTPTPTPKKPEEVSVREKWNLAFQSVRPTPNASATRAADRPDLPSSLPWHGNIVMTDLGPAWTVLYTRDGHPVIAEVKRGTGTIVFLTDSYLLSNEALVRDRHADLLAWVIGPNTHVVFDEAHHGIVDSPGLAAMARRYGLTAAALAFLAWVGLFLWKNASSLAPRQKTSRTEEPVEGRPSFAGFVAMLQRNIPPKELFAVCWKEWQKTFACSRRFSDARKVSAEAIVAAEAARPIRDRDPLEAFRRVHNALHHHSTQP